VQNKSPLPQEFEKIGVNEKELPRFEFLGERVRVRGQELRNFKSVSEGCFSFGFALAYASGCDFMTTLIREFERSDLPAIQLMAEQVTRDGTVFPFEIVEGVLDYWFSKGSRCYVATHEGQVAGTYVIKPNIPDRGGHIANAGYMVDERYRGKGIGRAMGDHSLFEARSLGYQAMQFNIVVATNHSAIKLWEKLGFNSLGVVPQGFRLPTGELVDLLIMHRQL